MSATASSIATVGSSCVSGGSCTSPSNNLSYPLTIPAGITAPASIKIFNSAIDSGMGRFVVTLGVNITIPGNSYVGTYTSTITLALSTGH